MISRFAQARKKPKGLSRPLPETQSTVPDRYKISAKLDGLIPKKLTRKGVTTLLHWYQRVSIAFLLSRFGAGLFLDPGLGKTLCMLTAFNILKKLGLAKKMLVVAPLRVAYNVWPVEILDWGFKLKCVVLHGPKKNDLLDEEADVYVINYDGLPWLVSKPGWQFDVLALDESSKVKNTQTRRFKILKSLRHKFRYIWIGTGSPVPNGLLDLFGQIYMLDGGVTLGHYITHYRYTFFEPTGYMGYDWKIKDGADKKILKAIESLVIRFSDKLLKLPKIVPTTIKVTLPPAARRTYNEMEAVLIARYKNKEIVASNAATAAGKCRQIASGFVYDENHRTVEIHREKIDALEDLVEELAGKPILVAYEFRHELAALLERFPKAPYIGGRLDGKKHRMEDDTEIIAQWNRGEHPLMFGSAQSMAYGLNMQESGYAVGWFTLTENLEYYEQFIRRVRRQGNKNKHCMLYHFIATDTIDESRLRLIDSKDKRQRSFLGAIEDRAKLRSAA